MARPALKIVQNDNTMSKEERRTRQYGEIILRSIKADAMLASANYFTRESLLVQLATQPRFGQVAVITRYRMICDGVRWLLDQDLLLRPNDSRTNLCLPVNLKRAQEALDYPVPLHMRYYDHILSMVREYEISDTTDVMTLVNRWIDEYDTPMTEDNMRVLTRYTLRNMASKKLLTENDDGTYTINASVFVL